MPVGAVALVVAGVALDGRLMFSPTPSLPRGFYLRTSETAASNPERFTVVVACLAEPWGLMARNRGYIGPGGCPGGAGPLGKVVVAGAGDVVCLDSAGVWVETVSGDRMGLLKHSAPLTRDSQGRPMRIAFGCRRLEDGQYWLYSGYTSRSFDSRYFGAVRREQIHANAHLLWSWESQYDVLQEPKRAFVTARTIPGANAHTIAPGREGIQNASSLRMTH